jgi:hypothetical protein
MWWCVGMSKSHIWACFKEFYKKTPKYGRWSSTQLNTTIPTFNFLELKVSTTIFNAFLDFKPCAYDGEQMMTKVEIL